MGLLLKSIENSPITSICHIFYDTDTLRCVIVDPGSETPDRIDDFVMSRHLQVDYIVLTHEHFDHIWSCDHFITKYNSTLLCTSNCLSAIQDVRTNLSIFYNQTKAFAVKPKKTIIVGDSNRVIKWIGYDMLFRNSEGHSFGGLLLSIEKYIVTGDSLIKGIKTVTKLRNASVEKLKETLVLLESMKGKNLIVCPGHGDIFYLDNYNLSIALGIK